MLNSMPNVLVRTNQLCSTITHGVVIKLNGISSMRLGAIQGNSGEQYNVTANFSAKIYTVGLLQYNV